MKSILEQPDDSREWVKDFYTQAGIWWGHDPQPLAEKEKRLKLIERLYGPGPRRILELGAGGGGTMAFMAEHGHSVVGVELNPSDAAYARELLKTPRTGSTTFLEADFYSVDLEGRFEVVCCWQVFGIGSDADQRRLLQRISREWLAPGGSVLLDVYHPAGPARDHGRERQLAPLPGVPGSVAMVERCSYDPVAGRWIDEWQPVDNPSSALALSVRCYTPADLVLLLEGTGLGLKSVEIEGQAISFAANTRMADRQFSWRDYNYLAQLAPV